MITLTTLVYALLGGFLPALVWLWFWLKEDTKKPEPRGFILLAFIAGLAAIPLVLPLERAAAVYITGSAVVLLWSVIEEVVKFTVARIVVLGRKVVDEPIDVVIYMITVALGFSALENTLFLLNPLVDGNLLNTILTGNLRFIGATLLHTLSSATVGVAMALSFYKPPSVRRWYLFAGIILATILHSVFNLFIIESNGEETFIVFLGVWIGIIALILILEKVKRIHKPGFHVVKGY